MKFRHTSEYPQMTEGELRRERDVLEIAFNEVHFVYLTPFYRLLGAAKRGDIVTMPSRRMADTLKAAAVARAAMKGISLIETELMRRPQAGA